MCDPMLRQPRLRRCHTTSSTSHYDILPFYVKNWQCGFESSLKLIEIMSRPYVYTKCATFGRKFLSCECDINQILREQGLDSSHEKIAQKEDCESKQRCVVAGNRKSLYTGLANTSIRQFQSYASRYTKMRMNTMYAPVGRNRLKSTELMAEVQFICWAQLFNGAGGVQKGLNPYSFIMGPEN